MPNSKDKIVIVDTNLGNLRSIEYKLIKENYDVQVSSKIEDILNADKLILAGVGHFGKAMENIRSLNLLDPLNQKVKIEKIPVFGICLGMQLFSNYSEEGAAEGLGWIDGEIVKFDFPIDSSFRVPHVGWNKLKFKKSHRYFDNIPSNHAYYFTHSYFFKTNSLDDIAQTDYGVNFCSVVCKSNVFGTQFHPEKSHKIGFNLLKNFCEVD